MSAWRGAGSFGMSGGWRGARTGWKKPPRRAASKSRERWRLEKQIHCGEVSVEHTDGHVHGRIAVPVDQDECVRTRGDEPHFARRARERAHDLERLIARN